MQITPLGQRVVVKPKAEETTTASGLILAKSTNEKPMSGEIVAAGADCKFVKAGDVVIYKKYTPTEFTLDNGDEVYLLEEDDLLATIA